MTGTYTVTTSTFGGRALHPDSSKASMSKSFMDNPLDTPWRTVW